MSVPAELAGLDWPRPWFAPYAALGPAVAAQAAAASSVPTGFDAHARTAGLADTPRFVPPELPPGMAYEQFIFETGSVPTRDNLHDFFNGLVWLCFPLAKRRLNRIQANEIARAGVGQVRGPVRDAVTLFDENAALLQAPSALWEALLAREWVHLFGELRPLWAQARLVLFGHALLEKLVAPYKSITAHVYRAPVPVSLGSDLAAWDAWLAHELEPTDLACKPFTPLPVLGVPGWWAANETSAFYQDAGVFRPAASGPSGRAMA